MARATSRKTTTRKKRSGGKLSAKSRKNIKRGNFAVPKGKGSTPGRNQYPIHDRAHARNALARVAQHGTPQEKAMVRRKVKAKFPSVGSR